MQDKKTNVDRRDFFKTSGAVLGGAVLTAASFTEAMAGPAHGLKKKKNDEMPPDAEPAVQYGQVHDPEALGNAFNAMIQIYATSQGYQHKFNDALVKAHLSYVEFLINKGMIQDYIAFDVAFLGPIMQRITERAKTRGKDYILTGMFEGTGCSFLLYEKIYKRENERLVVCPFRAGIRHNKFLGTSLTLRDVCTKYCIARWTAHGKACGIGLRVTPGKICSIKMI